MRTSNSLRWLVGALAAAMFMTLTAACGSETIEVPGETVVVEKEVIKEVMVPGETVVVEKIVTETVEVPGETVVKEVVKEVMVPGETVVVKEEVIKEVMVPGETVVKEVVKEIQVPGETIVVEKEVLKTVEVPGQTVVLEKEVVREVVVTPERYANNVWGELVEIPQHGGSIPMALGINLTDFDPWHITGNIVPMKLTLENLGHMDWAIAPDQFDWAKSGFTTIDTVSGALAESWEQPDPLTTIFNIRKGVNWQNKGEMNGREFDAYDVEFTFHRNFGLGDFAEAGTGPGFAYISNVSVESLEATDKWTIEIKSSEFTFDTLDVLYFYAYSLGLMVPREVIEEHGDMTDWRNVVGTGPYMLTDVVSDSSFTFERNPDYWKSDPRHPDLDLQLPYADEVKFFIMPELASRLAAMRTGKNAWMGGITRPTIDQVLSVQRTNPELVVLSVAGAPPGNIGFRSDRPPFSDLNVRIAMQKALNLEEVARVYYSGFANPTPWGIAAEGARGYYYRFEEWPDEVKWRYEYDPEAAEKLLDEAGYPRDANGIRFKTGHDAAPAWGNDVDVYQIAHSYWKAIGIEVELNVVPDSAAMEARHGSTTYEGITHCGCRHKNLDPVPALRGRFHSTRGWGGRSRFGVSDLEFDALMDAVDAATTREEKKNLFKEADLYFAANMYAMAFPPVVDALNLIQPWLKGYRGELGGSEDFWVEPIMYMWVDQDMKSKMGH